MTNYVCTSASPNKQNLLGINPKLLRILFALGEN